MKISVITVCWNCVNQIRETIRSVIGQDYLDLEYIIIDGNSTDGTKNIIEEYRSEISQYNSEPDLGIYDAMNKGISLASGKWTLFLNAGDLFYNDKVISNIFNNIESSKDCHVIFGSTIMKYSFGTYIVTPGNPEMLTKRMPFCHQSVFFRTSILKKNRII